MPVMEIQLLKYYAIAIPPNPHPQPPHTPKKNNNKKKKKEEKNEQTQNTTYNHTKIWKTILHV